MSTVELMSTPDEALAGIGFNIREKAAANRSSQLMIVLIRTYHLDIHSDYHSCHIFIMKLSVLATIAAAAASAVSASNSAGEHLGQDVLAQAKFLIELSPGETRWVTEEDKWELKRVRSLS